MTEYSPGLAADSAGRRRRVRAALALALLTLLNAWGSAGAGEPVRDHIPLAEIEPGMTGYGLTVFRGVTVDTFGVKVIGVQEKVRAAGSLLLIEVSGHDLETSSIAQGMSGSPIYLNGRFAGALAFGWGGALRPIAGVTPAAEMLALPTDIPPTARPRQALTDVTAHQLIPLGTNATALAQDIWGSVTAPLGSRAIEPVDNTWPDAPQMWLNLATNLTAGDAGTHLPPERWIFQPLGLTGASAAAANATAPPRLVPGAACAVPLVTGDAALGAIGTVTWVEGDQVLMMGHPFMQRGPVNLPLATAEVLTIFPSREMSFKMGSVGQIVGTVHHDLRAGLSGRMGVAPPLIPVTVTVARAGAPAQEYEFGVVDDPILTPNLVFWTIYNALLATSDDMSLQTMRYEVESIWSGPSTLSAEPLMLRGVTAGPGGAAGLAREVAAPLSILLNNPHATVQLREVRARLEQVRPLQTAAIVGLTSPRSVARAGQKLDFHIEIEPRLGDRQTLTIPITLPPHLPAGPYRVVVASASELFALEAQRAAGRFQPVNLSGVLDILRTGRARDSLVLALFSPGQATILQGQELGNLPASVARTVRAGNMQAQRSLADYAWRHEQIMPWALTGHAVRSLRVQPTEKPFVEERRP
jgi:hypothetical protein